MSLVGFSWWSRCSEVSASDIRPSGLRCLWPPNLELSSAQDQTIAWQFIAFQTETESASVSAVLSASVDLYLMKGLLSFIYYYYYYYSKVLMMEFYRFLKFPHYSCFWGQWIYCWHFYWATMFVWPRKSRSASGTGGIWRYWWLCLMDFFSIYVFEVKESISIELPCLGNFVNPGQLPVQEVLEGTYWWFWLIDFWNFFTIHVLEVNESIADDSTELPCSGDFENPVQLPIQEVIKGTDDCVV